MKIRCWHEPKRRRIHFESPGHDEIFAYPRQLSRDEVLRAVDEIIAEKHWEDVTINRGTFPEKPSELEPGTLAERELGELGEHYVFGVCGVRFDTDLLGGW